MGLPEPEKNRLVEENGSSWRDYKVYLLNSIEVINDTLKDARKERTQMHIEISSLKKDVSNHSKVWGSVAGVGSALLTILITKFFGL